MKVSAKAVQKIKRLRSRRSLSPATGVRLALKDGAVRLSWDAQGPAAGDMVIRQSGIPLFIGARDYVRLADLELDLQEEDGAGRFLLKHKRAVEKQYRRKPS